MSAKDTKDNPLQILLNSPITAIYAVINDFDKTVDISYTLNFQHRLGIISSDILQRQVDVTKYHIIILETNVDRVFVKYYIDQYRNNGYTVLDRKIPVQYRFKIEMERVVAINNRNEKIVLGNFKTLTEAENFLSYITRNNLTTNLIYSIYG